ncbi:MAG: Mur ligase domain-containing protein [bacterium]|nr:Mur ligase domain-containing protein [bacterium]
MKALHFVGIGGIGMSALAQMLVHEGMQVTGSDREASPVTEMLEKKGIRVSVGQVAENVPTSAELVVYSDAVPADNPERAEAAKRGIPQLSYFQMLGKVSAGKAPFAEGFGGPRRTVAVAGTHGKTTTAGMLAKILIDAGAAPTAIIGSIVKDFDSNYVAGASDLFVVEACEYRDHLLELSPEVLVITNLEWDHTDYFPSLAALQETFARAVAKVPENGAIVTNPVNPNIAPVLRGARAQVVDYTKEPTCELLLPGEFNQQNARAAAAAARVAFPSVQSLALHNSLVSFHGTWRRFEYKGKTVAGVEVYDDYAHHPTAICETLKALRAKTKGRIFVAFHPHLYSRTRDLLDEFATAFANADEVLIAPIYAAREVDDGSISSQLLAERVQASGTHARAATFTEIKSILNTEPKSGDTIMTMGAGDIYKVAGALIEK